MSPRTADPGLAFRRAYDPPQIYGSRTQRRADIHDRLRAAVESLVEGGESYANLSVERIASTAGISRATFYVYFSDKVALLEAMAAAFTDGLIEAASGWWSLPGSLSKEDLSAAIGAIFDAYLPHKEIMAAVAEVGAHDPDIGGVLAGLVDRAVAGLAGHISAGQEEGWVARGLDPLRTAEWLCWMAERGMYQLARPAGRGTAARLQAALTDILWNTLYVGARRSES